MASKPTVREIVEYHAGGGMSGVEYQRVAEYFERAERIEKAAKDALDAWRFGDGGASSAEKLAMAFANLFSAIEAGEE